MPFVRWPTLWPEADPWGCLVWVLWGSDLVKKARPWEPISDPPVLSSGLTTVLPASGFILYLSHSCWAVKTASQLPILEWCTMSCWLISSDGSFHKAIPLMSTIFAQALECVCCLSTSSYDPNPQCTWVSFLFSLLYLTNNIYQHRKIGPQKGMPQTRNVAQLVEGFPGSDPKGHIN